MRSLPQTTNKSKFPWRFAVYALVGLYFVLDLYVIKGPLYKKIHSKRAEATFEKAHGELAATVNAHPITEKELDEAIRVYCWQRGIDLDTLKPKRRTAIRALVLNERIDDILIWMFSRADPVEILEAEYKAAITNFKRQFQSQEDLEKRMKAQGFTERTLETWLKTQHQQRRWIDSKIAAEIKVEAREARYWYETNREQTGIPEVIRARHLFLATLDKDPAEVEEIIRGLHTSLKQGEAEFAQLVAEHSEDERNRGSGGNLNYFTKARVPADFHEAVESLPIGEISEPFQTKLGWHIAEVTERKPARIASFEEMKDEITAMLESHKRSQAIPQLIKSYRGRARIQLYKHPANG